ncbi:MAG: RtcB family protein, partial [Candidatus Omnitrophica bacterium]|nr:RtcB family protein [Candidatus Omnitrophota bacterium]
LTDALNWAKQKYKIEKESSDFLDQIYGESKPALSARDVIFSFPRDAFWGGYFRLGTLGGGNHFLEAQTVDRLIDKPAAERLGLSEGQIIFMFHTGSGVLSKRLDNYYGIRYENNIWYKDLRKRLRKYSFHLGDLRLWRFNKRSSFFFSGKFKGIPADSLEAKRFMVALQASLNYSFANRAIISDFIREALGNTIKKDFSISFLSDTIHERIDYEQFQGNNFWVHRNGAVKVCYRNADMEILPIPGFMGGPSFLCLPEKGVIDSRYSVNHGAGRVFDKEEAKNKFSSQDIFGALEQKGIRLFKLGKEDIREQAPAAFKDIYKVLESLKSNRLVAPIASTSPLAILKG